MIQMLCVLPAHFFIFPTIIQEDKVLPCFVFYVLFLMLFTVPGRECVFQTFLLKNRIDRQRDSLGLCIENHLKTKCMYSRRPLLVTLKLKEHTGQFFKMMNSNKVENINILIQKWEFCINGRQREVFWYQNFYLTWSMPLIMIWMNKKNIITMICDF